MAVRRRTLALGWYGPVTSEESTSVTCTVIKHRGRLTRCCLHYLDAILQAQGQFIEVVNLAERDKENLFVRLVAIVYAFTAPVWSAARQAQD